MATLALCRLSEPVAMTSVFPYLFFMIRDFNVAENERQIGRYVGFLASSFSFSQFLTGIQWGSLSDKIGRKPVILLGLCGTIVSSVAFGFSQSFVMALCARSAAGLLNGNVGVIRTVVAELITDKKHQSVAFSIMPTVWSIGSIFGPALGGALSDPVHQYPNMFGNNAFFKKFPYALPNLVSSSILLFCVIFGFLFLEETLESKRSKPDYGIEIRKAIAGFLWNPRKYIKPKKSYEALKRKAQRIRHRSRMPSNSSEMSFLSDINDEASVPFLSNMSPVESPIRNGKRPQLVIDGADNIKRPLPSVYERHRRSSSFQRTTGAASDIENHVEGQVKTSIFKEQVVLNIIVYATLSLHSTSFDQIFPLFCSTPIELYGLGMSAKQVGLILSIAGVLAIILQITVFPVICTRFGPVKCLRVVLLLYVSVYMSTMISILSVRVLCGAFAFPCSAILITNSAPSKSHLGTINGMNQAFASLARAIGPSISGWIFTESEELDNPELVWICMSGAAFLTFLFSWLLREFPPIGNTEQKLPELDGYSGEDGNKSTTRQRRRQSSSSFSRQGLLHPDTEDQYEGEQDYGNEAEHDDDVVTNYSHYILSRRETTNPNT